MACHYGRRGRARSVFCRREAVCKARSTELHVSVHVYDLWFVNDCTPVQLLLRTMTSRDVIMDLSTSDVRNNLGSNACLNSPTAKHTVNNMRETFNKFKDFFFQKDNSECTVNQISYSCIMTNALNFCLVFCMKLQTETDNF